MRVKQIFAASGKMGSGDHQVVRHVSKPCPLLRVRQSRGSTHHLSVRSRAIAHCRGLSGPDHYRCRHATDTPAGSARQLTGIVWTALASRRSEFCGISNDLKMEMLTPKPRNENARSSDPSVCPHPIARLPDVRPLKPQIFTNPLTTCRKTAVQLNGYWQ